MSAGRWVPVQTDTGLHLRLVGANGETMLTSQVYATGMEGITNAMRVIQETPPTLGSVVDERMMSNPKTTEEKIAFRKDWDARYEEGQYRAGNDQDG